MHEMSLMSNIIAAAEQALEPYNVARVNSISVRAGILANVLPDAFEYAFEALSAATVLSGAALKVEKAPLQARCNDCAAAYDSMRIPPRCPNCGSTNAAIIGGTEVLLAAIDFDEEE